MTGVWTARLHSNALDIGHRVRPEPGRTLTDGLVVVRDADRVYAARILVAGIIAGVREPVAELSWRAVDVVDARYCSTSGGRVVRIARVESGRALAVGHVVVDDAESVRAAGDEVADQLAGERTVRGAATRLILLALAVGGAAILARTVTTATVVRIASVAWQAVATALMILGHAARVRGAGEAAAERHALEHSQRVRPAALARVALAVAYTVGHRWLLARRQHRVPFVAILALASRAPRHDVRLAFLISTAHHLAARIHALVHAAVQDDAEGSRLAVRVARASGYHGFRRLATLDQIARVALVSIDAQTGRRVVLRDAERVGSALQLAAGIHALANSLAYLEADLLRLALEIVRAVTVQVATLVQVIGIAAVTRRTYARTVLADGSGSTFYVAALVHAFITDARVIERARYGIATYAGRRIGARSYLHLLTANEGIAEEAVLATTVVASDSVDAHRIAAARVPVALVDV